MANLLAPDGWQRFRRQKKYSVGGFYFICPEICCFLLVQSGFRVVRASSPTKGNTYLNRDFLVLVEKPPPSENATASGEGCRTQGHEGEIQEVREEPSAA